MIKLDPLYEYSEERTKNDKVGPLEAEYNQKMIGLILYSAEPSKGDIRHLSMAQVASLCYLLRTWHLSLNSS